VWVVRRQRVNDLYRSPSIVWVIKQRIMGWAGRVARVGGGEERCVQGFGGET